MISVSVIVDENLAIGYENDLLARIPEDLKHFKEITDGKMVIMGYNTYESLPENSRPLPNRKNVVLTSRDIDIEGVTIKHSLEEVLELIKADYSAEEVFIIGGGSIYRQFMPYVDRLYVTHVFRQFEADTHFPEIGDEWEIIDVRADKENINNKVPHVFVTYERKNSKKL